MATEHTTRQTRKAQERPVEWAPPKKLDTPTPPDGMKYRWVRAMIHNDEDIQNVLNRQRQHYEVVRIEELNEAERAMYQTIDEGKLAGVVRVGDLILMKVPIEIAEQRNAYYERKAQQLQRQVDQELDRNNSAKMPIHKDRDTKVSVGRGRANFED